MRILIQALWLKIFFPLLPLGEPLGQGSQEGQALQRGGSGEDPGAPKEAVSPVQGLGRPSSHAALGPGWD